MNPKILIISFFVLGIGIVVYNSYSHDEMPQMQNPHSVQKTSENQGAALVEIEVPDLSDRAKLGKLVFDTSCAACHGENAVGQDGVAPPLVHIIYEPNHHGDAAFLLAAKNGVRAHHWPFGNMPPVQNVSDDSVKLIIDYVRELQRANGIN